MDYRTKPEAACLAITVVPNGLSRKDISSLAARIERWGLFIHNPPNPIRGFIGFAGARQSAAVIDAPLQIANEKACNGARRASHDPPSPISLANSAVNFIDRGWVEME